MAFYWPAFTIDWDYVNRLVRESDRALKENKEVANNIDVTVVVDGDDDFKVQSTIKAIELALRKIPQMSVITKGRSARFFRGDNIEAREYVPTSVEIIAGE